MLSLNANDSARDGPTVAKAVEGCSDGSMFPQRLSHVCVGVKDMKARAPTGIL